MAFDLGSRIGIPATKHRLSASPATCIWGYIDRETPPVLEVEPGDIIEIEAVTHHAGDAPDLLMDDGIRAIWAGLGFGNPVAGVRQMFTLHVFLGLFVIPVVCFKLATTGYRFFHYHRGTAPIVTRARLIPCCASRPPRGTGDHLGSRQRRGDAGCWPSTLRHVAHHPSAKFHRLGRSDVSARDRSHQRDVAAHH